MMQQPMYTRAFLSLLLCLPLHAFLHTPSPQSPMPLVRGLVTRPGRPLFGDLDVTFEELDGSNCRIGIVKTRWNPKIVGSLYEGVKTALKEAGVKDSNIYDTTVPGAFELPLATRFLALSRQCDVVIALGCLIKGDTMHFEYIADAVANGLMSTQLQTTIPVIFGVLTTLDEKQALARSQGENNHGLGWGKTAVEMALLRQAALAGNKSERLLVLVVSVDGVCEQSTLPITEKREVIDPEKKQERKFGF